MTSSDPISDPATASEPEPDQPEWMICRTCGWPLERRVRQEEISWLHLREDPGYNHEPDPVPASQATLINQRCDFCDTIPVTDIVLCQRFEMMDGQFSAGHWAACAQCGTLIRNRRWGQLVTHVKQNSDRHRAVRSVPRKHLVDLYGKVERYSTGVITFAEWTQRTGYRVDISGSAEESGRTED
jgi:hypothetical protein